MLQLRISFVIATCLLLAACSEGKIAQSGDASLRGGEAGAAGAPTADGGSLDARVGSPDAAPPDTGTQPDPDAGMMSMTVCAAKKADCDDDGTCETHTAVDPSHCGSCTTVCAFTNAADTCVSNACQMGTCTTGFADCKGGTGNGCETAITTVTDCGGCGVQCNSINSTASCNAGTAKCQMSCTGSFDDCNKVGSDGCEINRASDVNNCGACNNKCTAGWACQSGTCVNPAAIKQVRGGSNFSCALTYGGAIECWGRNQFHQLGTNTAAVTQATPITIGGTSRVYTSLAVGDEHACAVSDGQVYCWGNSTDSRAGVDYTLLTGQAGGCPDGHLCQPAATGITGVTEVDAGLRITCALKTDQTVVCWGTGQSGQLPPAPSHVPEMLSRDRWRESGGRQAGSGACAAWRS